MIWQQKHKENQKFSGALAVQSTLPCLEGFTTNEVVDSTHVYCSVRDITGEVLLIQDKTVRANIDHIAYFGRSHHREIFPKYSHTKEFPLYSITYGV